MTRPVQHPASTSEARKRAAEQTEQALLLRSVQDLRHLVILDPEDSEQMERLSRAAMEVRDSGDLPDEPMTKGALLIRATLRSLLEPPKLAEPTGRYAVVVDANGDEWVRDGLQKDNASIGAWWSSTRAQASSPDPWRADWDELNIAVVLTGGVFA